MDASRTESRLSSTVESENSETITARYPDFSEAKKLLDLAMDLTDDYPVVTALLFDQISTVLGANCYAGGPGMEVSLNFGLPFGDPALVIFQWSQVHGNI